MAPQKKDVKQIILNTAITEFYVEGFAGANMRRIARKARMVVGNIYRYFKSKEELFNACVEPAFNALADLIQTNPELENKNLDSISYLNLVLKSFSKICLQYPKELVCIIDRYIRVKNYPLLESLETLIVERLNREIPNISENQADIIYHLMLSGVLYVLQTTKKQDIDIQLKHLFLIIFENIEKRYN